MAKLPFLPNCRLQSIPTISDFAINQSELDLDALTLFNPNVNKTFIGALKEELIEIRKLVPPIVLTEDMVEANQKLDNLVLSGRSLLNKLEAILNSAKGKLKSDKKHFGIGESRICISAFSASRTPAALKIVLSHIDENIDVLTEKGYTAVDRAAIETLKDKIIHDYNEITKTVGARSELSVENRLRLSIFWEKVDILLKTGKLLFADNLAKKREYTFAVLKRRVETPKKRKNKGDDTNTPPSPVS